MTEQRFKSKVDVWLVLLPSAGLVAPFVVAVWRVANGLPSSGAPVVVLPVVLLLGWMAVSLEYVVTDAAITVRFGPFRRRRPIPDLTRLTTTRSIESSPALSLDRIAISTTRGFWLNVSPADKAGFVRAIRERAPHVALDEPLATLVR